MQELNKKSNQYQYLNHLLPPIKQLLIDLIVLKILAFYFHYQYRLIPSLY